jgi:sortase (surface protein transpeptidase)
MNPRFALITFLTFILILTGCQAGADTSQSDPPPPTATMEVATATIPAPVVTMEPEAPATTVPVATEMVPVTSVPTTEVSVVEPTVEPETPAATPIPPAMPILLNIPKIEVSASIESVGNDTQGRMDVPQGVDNAAWWNMGPLPGGPGNAVISGHLDTYLQEPAVFWRLRELVPGDMISVRDARGVDHNFEVVNSETYEHDQVPLDVIFGDAVRIRPNLILITCEGTWDTNSRNYDQRFVVYAKMVQ